MKYFRNLVTVLTPLILGATSHATLVYVPDQTSGSILKFVGETGEYKGIIGNGFVGTNVRSLVQSPNDGYLYVNTVSGGQGLIQRFDPYTGAYAGMLATGFLSNPRGMTFGTDGRLYVVDNRGAASLILRFNAETGAYLGTLASGFLGDMTNSGSIVSVGTSLFVTGGSGTAIQKFDFDGTYRGAIGSGFFTNGYGLSVYEEAGSDVLMVGSFSTTAILKFKISDSSYKGIFASGFLPIGRGIAMLPNGQTIARSRSATGVDYICRFVPSTGEYKGLFAANFNIIGLDLAAESAANLNLNVNLLDWNDALCAHPLTVEIRNNVTQAVLETINVTSSPTGALNIKTFLRGTFSIAVKGQHFLRKVVNNVVIGRAGSSTISYALPNGDIDDDNFVGLDDFNLLSNSFNLALDEPGYNANADLDCDDFVGLDDFNILSNNFNTSGDD